MKQIKVKRDIRRLQTLGARFLKAIERLNKRNRELNKKALDGYYQFRYYMNHRGKSQKARQSLRDQQSRTLHIYQQLKKLRVWEKDYQSRAPKYFLRLTRSEIGKIQRNLVRQGVNF